MISILEVIIVLSVAMGLFGSIGFLVHRALVARYKLTINDQKSRIKALEKRVR